MQRTKDKIFALMSRGLFVDILLPQNKKHLRFAHHFCNALGIGIECK